jgi:signal peptidase II
MDKKQKNIKKVKPSEKTIPKKAEICSTVSCIWAISGMGLAAVIFILDQLSKWFVLNNIMVPPHTLRITSFFNIVLAWNRGISFGLLSSNNPYNIIILSGIALAFSAVITFWIWRAETKTMALAFGLVLGGAVGNLLDRLRFGAVTDFLDFHLYGYHWYTFNVADAAIVGGVGIIFLEYIREIWSESKK